MSGPSFAVDMGAGRVNAVALGRAIKMWMQACTPIFAFGLFCGSVVSSLNQGTLPRLRLKAPPSFHSPYFVAPIQFQSSRPHCPGWEILRRQGR